MQHLPRFYTFAKQLLTSSFALFFFFLYFSILFPSSINAQTACNLGGTCKNKSNCGGSGPACFGIQCVAGKCVDTNAPASGAGTSGGTPPTPTVTPSIKFAKKLGPSLPVDPNMNPLKMLESKSRGAWLFIPVDKEDLGDKNTKWAIRVRCGQFESDFPKYYSYQEEKHKEKLEEVPSGPKGATGLKIFLYNNGQDLFHGPDCEFQTAGKNLTRPIDIEVYKNEKLYGSTFYTVDAPVGILLPDAITGQGTEPRPIPITEKTTSATLFVPVPPDKELNNIDPKDPLRGQSNTEWELQIRCGAAFFGFADRYAMPKRIIANTFGEADFNVLNGAVITNFKEEDGRIVKDKDGNSAYHYNTILFTLTNESEGGEQACEFVTGDAIDIELYHNNVLYGRSRYYVSPKNASTFLPPPCTKWSATTRSGEEVPITQEVKTYGGRQGTSDLSEWIKEKGYEDYRCMEVETPVGGIQTTPTGLVQSIYGILLSLAGGIALILIMLSGYQIMTSQGDPEKIQGARETITSAIIGLMFILMSLVILQIIGYDILQIPELKP